MQSHGANEFIRWHVPKKRPEDGRVKLRHESAQEHPCPLVLLGIPAKRGGGGRTVKDRTTVMEAEINDIPENPEQQGATLETTTSAENSQHTCATRPTQTGPGRLRPRGMSWPSDPSAFEEELSQSMQDVEDQWQEKYSTREERHKEMLKLKGEVLQKRER